MHMYYMMVILLVSAYMLNIGDDVGECVVNICMVCHMFMHES